MASLNASHPKYDEILRITDPEISNSDSWFNLVGKLAFFPQGNGKLSFLFRECKRFPFSPRETIGKLQPFFEEVRNYPFICLFWIRKDCVLFLWNNRESKSFFFFYKKEKVQERKGRSSTNLLPNFRSENVNFGVSSQFIIPKLMEHASPHLREGYLFVIYLKSLNSLKISVCPISVRLTYFIPYLFI